MAQSSAQKKAAAKARRKQAESLGKQPTAKRQRNQLQQKMGEMQMALLNTRQMYDQKVMEVEAFKQQITQRDQLLTAIAADRRGRKLVIKETTLVAVAEGKWAGYGIDVDEKTGNITLSAVDASKLEEDDSE